MARAPCTPYFEHMARSVGNFPALLLNYAFQHAGPEHCGIRFSHLGPHNKIWSRSKNVTQAVSHILDGGSHMPRSMLTALSRMNQLLNLSTNRCGQRSSIHKNFQPSIPTHGLYFFAYNTSRRRLQEPNAFPSVCIFRAFFLSAMANRRFALRYLPFTGDTV